MRLCCTAVAVALLLPAGAVRAQSFGQMIVFGDSLSDTGNVSNATFGFSPGGNYFEGRFSNGILWHEVMAGSLGLAAATPSRMAGGRNYAHGGVRTGSGNTSFFPFSFPNVGTQINQFLSGNTPNANQIFTVLAGGNDFLDNLSQNPATIVNNLVNHVTALNNAGARYIVVPNLPLLGETPRYNTTANRTAYNNLTANFNAQLATALTSLDAQLPARIYQYDLAGTLGQVLASPGAFGLVNVTQPALVGGTVVPNPDGYLFYDDIHPTRVGHRLLARGAFDLVTTHNWVAGSGDWSTAGNWEVAGVPAANWIAAIDNRSAGAFTVSLPSGSAGATVRRVRVRGSTAGATLGLGPGAGLGVSESVSLDAGATLDLAPASLLTTPQVTIAAGGAMQGSGRVTGVVNSSGVVEARGAGTQSFGTLSIGGDYVASAVAATRVTLGALPLASDRVVIDGAATLAGMLQVGAAPGETPLPGNVYEVMRFGTVSGALGIENQTGFAGLLFQQSYAGGALTLTLSALGGDANLDARVDIGDFAVLAGNFNSPPPQNWLAGNFNADASVDIADFAVLAANFNLGTGARPVPEPGGAALLVGMVGLFGRRGRRGACGVR